MKQLFLSAALLVIGFLNAQVKIGDNPTSLHAASLLELESTTQGFLPPRMTTTQRDAINAGAAPTGLVIYNTTIGCIQVNLGTPSVPNWQCLTSVSVTSGGTAIISAYSCSTNATGSMSSGNVVSGVTQTITATVVTPGTYNILASANGVTYLGVGVFYNPGNYDIVLTATGTPTSMGTFSFVLSTTPSCSFNIDVTDGSSGGTASVSSYNCATASTGNLLVNQAVSGVTQTLTASVVTIGTYNISTTANGVTFSASGSFSGTGNQTLVLTATGTPTVSGAFNYNLITNPSCSFTRTAVVTPVVSSIDCTSAVLTGTLVASFPATGIFATVPYSGGNGYSFNTQLIPSAGVIGLTASLVAGTLENGTGTFTFSISGTANLPGVASFPFSFGAQSCTFYVNVATPAAITTLSNCAFATAGTITSGVAASGVTQTIEYTGGNGGVYNALSFSASGVTGLTATAVAGSLATGTGTIVLTISGTPSASGTASFNVISGGSTCTFTRTVAAPAATITGLTCGSVTYSPTIFTQNVAYSGSASIPYTGGNSGTYSAGSPIASTGVIGLTATLVAGTLSSGAATISYTLSGSPASGGTASFALSFGGQTCTLTTTVAALPPLPGNITLTAISPYFIASVNDSDYIPYTIPTVVASLATAQAAGGGNEATTINIQGTLTTTGVTITIPYTVVTATVSLPAYSSTITIPASYTEDGLSRDITFSYSGGTKAVGTGTITATLLSVGDILNVKKLDIQTGIGSDTLGWLLGQFVYATNSSGSTANFQVRDIAGIPDRNINDVNHVMLYLPVTGADGNVWLNNNLGADYANTAKTSFDPAQQATAYNDYKAYGSLFQWGRYSDGHELINRTSSTAGTFVNGNTTTLSTTDTPDNSLFITSTDWRSPKNDALWQGEIGTNNPCPCGFRVATDAEFTTLFTASGITNYTNAASSALKFTAQGFRSSSVGTLFSAAINGLYCSSSVSGNMEIRRQFNSTSMSNTADIRGHGFAVRCIKN